MTRHGTRVIREAVLLRLDDIVILPNMASLSTAVWDWLASSVP